LADKDIELTEIFDVGFDRKKRRIYFGTTKVEENDDHGSVCWKSVEDAIRQMHVLVKDNARKPIEIHSYSWGGDVYAMLRMIDEIEACPCKVVFIGGGKIASAMTWIMAVCDERLLHKNTVVMLHDGVDSVEGKHTDVQVDAKHGLDLQERIDKIFAHNSIMPFEFWQDVLQRDVYMTAEETIQIGLADKIIEPKKRGNLRRSRIALMNKPRDAKEMKKLVKSMYERTNRKNMRKLELEIPKEQCDPDVIVDESEMEPLMKSHQEDLPQPASAPSSEENS
jgi:ATP-dependent Clp protease, protease subunit